MPDFSFCLNTSTIQPASLLDKIRIAGEAGYSGIELWINDVEGYLAEGHKVAEVRTALDDAGLARPSMISLRDWCTADEAKFAAAVDAAKRRLDLARELGVERIVAGPPGDDVPQALAVERYGQILDISIDRGVPASLEFLGFVKGINTLERAWAICGSVGNPAGTITPDVWHMFRGGSDFKVLDDIPVDHISCFHWNDAPREPTREQQTDADRVYPGDGILDLHALADTLREKSFTGALSLELFNRDYWKQDPLVVARTGLEKMRASVAPG
ncbi:MAG: sugar phosphate isomerase/epimerase [Pirellulales bacterium]|nr:sugar phosphate isomerase/epimerase [Pirellulales bacterium]